MTVAFEKVLASLNLPPNPTILDVGAGGFLGTNTTVYLLKLPGAKIDAIEVHPERAKALAEKFAGRLTVIADDFTQHEFSGWYDLIVLDPDSQYIPAIFEQWLPGRVKMLLKPGGAVIAVCFGYAPEVPIETYGLAEEVQVLAKDFLTRKFGAMTLTPDIVNAAYNKEPDYRFVSMLGKLGNPPPETIVWIGLQRR
jgi:predicted O-methyltransferase YrrM